MGLIISDYPIISDATERSHHIIYMYNVPLTIYCTSWLVNNAIANIWTNLFLLTSHVIQNSMYTDVQKKFCHEKWRLFFKFVDAWTQESAVEYFVAEYCDMYYFYTIIKHDILPFNILCCPQSNSQYTCFMGKHSSLRLFDWCSDVED